MLFVIEACDRRSSQHTERIWQHLWELRDAVPVSVVLPTVVSSPCPLLAEETADTVCSATGMQVPQASAWVPFEVDLSHFLNSNGDIRLQALEKALTECVDKGEQHHDACRWGATSLKYDSWLNRRLAVAIRGWGGVVQRRGDDPRRFRTLRELLELAEFVTATLVTRSRALAEQRGHCPALDVTDTHLAGSGPEMRARWRRAVDDTALRHRNLTMMSPWDVFPAGEPADLAYVDLLPLLRCANCVSFQRGVDISHWNVNEFRRFYERISAILQGGSDAGLIAKQV